MLTWIARRRGALWGALVLTFAMASTAGATAGAMLHLGVTNTHNATTTLTGSVTGAQMRVVNKGSGPALALSVDSNRPALSVNSRAKVPNLNSDRLDNLDSSAFQRRITTSCPAGSSIRAVASSGAVTCEADDINGGDAATIDGLDSSAFQRRVSGSCAIGSAIAAIGSDGSVTCAADAVDGGDAATLNGLPASAFLGATVTTKVTGPWANNAGQLDVGSADCDSGGVAISGGVSTQATKALPWSGFEPSTQVVNTSAPNPKGTGWSVAVTNEGTAHRTFHVYVICATGASAVSSTEAPTP